MMEYPQQQQQRRTQQQQQLPLRSTPQRTVLTLSPTGGKSDYSRLLPPPAVKSVSSVSSWKIQQQRQQDMTPLPTLTPERVKQTLQLSSPLRKSTTTLKATTSQTKNDAPSSPTPPTTRRSMSAFTSPQQQQQRPKQQPSLLQQQQKQERRLPTETALAEGELNFFTSSRVTTDLSFSSTNHKTDNNSIQVDLPHNLRPVKQFYHSSQHVSLEYISPATTPARSENENDMMMMINTTPFQQMIDEDDQMLSSNAGGGDAFSSSVAIYNSERQIVNDVDVAGMVIPVKASISATTTIPNDTTAMMATPEMMVGSGDSGIILDNQQVHLLEQKHEHLLIQQEQELLQQQLQREFYDDEQQKDEEFALQKQLQNEFCNDDDDVQQQLQQQDRLSQMEYQFHNQVDETIIENSDMRPVTFEKFSSTHAIAGDFVVPEILEQAILQQNPNLFDPNFSLQIGKMVEESNMERISESATDEAQPDLSISQYSENASNSVQKLVVERMMAIPSAEVSSSSARSERNRRSSTCRRANRDRNTNTPRISNSSSGSESDAVSMEDDIKNQYAVDKKWPVEAVDSLKSTMTRAVGKLKTLANHMSKQTNDSVPEAVNTSTESSSSSTDPSTNSGLDLTDLAGELRNNASESQIHHQRRNSAASFDTLGAPKPASLAQASVPPSNLQKPVPLNPAKVSPRLPPASKIYPDSLNNKNGQVFFVSKPAADSRTRAVTPIVRMRNQEVAQMELTLPETRHTTIVDDITTMKQKNWRIAKKNREEEKSKVAFNDEQNRKSHGDREKQRQPVKKTKLKMRKNSREPSFFVVAGHKYQIPRGIPTCKGDVIELLENFMSTRCGNLNDTYDGDEEGDDDSLDSNELSFYSDDYESGSESEASTVDKPKQKAESKSASQGGAISFVEEKVPKNKITVDINDKQFIRQFITAAATEGIVLLVHLKNRSKALRRPSKNIAYLRRGTQSTTGAFIGPKLVWKEIRGDVGGEIDLFAIRSLEKATVLELENYPYAMPGRSLFLRLNEGVDYVFEARSENEALRFVHGMRWLIARLAFNLIIGNVSVSCELLDVGEKSNIDDRYGMFPRSVKEESQWTVAMNEATTHLVQEVSKSIH